MIINLNVLIYSILKKYTLSLLPDISNIFFILSEIVIFRDKLKSFILLFEKSIDIKSKNLDSYY